MFWTLRENLCGIKHSARFLGRVLLGRPRGYYVQILQKDGFAVEPIFDDLGKTLDCRLCGYTNMSFDLSAGFKMTACSSLSRSVLEQQDKLKSWATDMPKNSKEALQKAGLESSAIAGD
jgi:hypothetical protein